MSEQDLPPIRPSWTFSVWLAFQETRKDKVGDLARTIRKDPVWPGWRNVEGLEAYCRAQGFPPALIAALQQAWGEWEVARRASEVDPRRKK